MSLPLDAAGGGAQPVAGAAISDPRPAPAGWLGTVRQLGPGLIITAIIVGSGELIVTPKLGASAGFQLLWFIVAGCLVKVFVQVELGRHAIVRGMTTLAALDTVPGPRARVSWLVWLWLVMYLALVFQVAGILGGVASIFRLGGLGLPTPWLAVLVGGSCTALLMAGRYRLIEWVSTALVALFTVTTVTAVALLQSTPYAITPAQLVSGLRFELPDSFTTAFAALGIIGVGASELIYYPYWCLEKGYARHVGQRDGSPPWLARAKGWLRVMSLDAWVSFALYTTATVAFYLLGAAVLHAKGLVVEDRLMIETLWHMYQETFGGWSQWLFLVGAFAVLYSTLFGATASNARLFADALEVFGVLRYRSPEHRARWVRAGCVLLPVAFTGVYLAFGSPVTLVFVGAVAQGLMLPFLALAAIHFRFREADAALRPGAAWTAGLFLSALALAAAGIYQVVAQVLPAGR